MIEIRIFEPGYDKKDFYEIMGDPLTMPGIKKELPYLSNTPESIWFLAMSDSTLLGFGAIHPGKSSINLRNLYVYPEYRGKGIGKKLVEEWLNYAKKYPLPITTVVSVQGMKTVYKICQKMGFVETKRTKNYVFLRRE